MTTPPFLVWVDLETSGLDPYVDEIYEIGFSVTDLDLKELESANWICGKHTTTEQGISENPFVREIHKKSGLTQAVLASDVFAGDIGEEIREFFTYIIKDYYDDPDIVTLENGILGPMCGSTVHFDKEFLKQDLPEVVDLFAYRVIDVSSIIEMCARWNPEVLARREEVTSPQKLHRVLPDLQDTIEELKFYRDNFLFVTE